MLVRFLWRLAANSLGLWIAARLISGIEYGGSLWVIVIAAVIFSLVNMLLKPILVILSLPAIILSLGLFMFIINGFLLYLVTAIYPQFQVESFGAALLAVIVVWLVNWAVSVVTDKGGSHA